jgi:ribonuclease HI
MPEFTCRQCGATFSLPESVLARYPGWTPATCRACREGSGTGGTGSRRRRGEQATTDDVLATYQSGPDSGVFTDGSAVPNPGPGGWGAVYVIDGAIVAERHGHEPDTTNNRMELTALLEGAELVPEGTAATVYSDSRLAVRTITEWAAGWERRGWKRKSGPVENLDLVKRAFTVYRRRPELKVEWIAAHAGHRWNEYADALAGRWRTSG